MSHRAWAKAQDVGPKAKAVLSAFADYADVAGKGFVAIRVLVIETSMGERSVQRGLAEAREAKLIKDTGEWVTHQGKRYPVYQLQLDRGPQNTRDRLRRERDVAGLREVGALGVSNSHPTGASGVSNSHPKNPRGDSTDTPRGDSTDTQIEPKISSLEAKASRSERAREPDRSVFRKALAAYPKSGRSVSDVEASWLLWSGSDVSQDKLLAAVQRYAADPGLKRRDFGAPSLQRWLAERRFEAWLTDDPAVAPPPNAVWTGDVEFRAAVAARLGENFAAAYLDPCGWDDVERALIPRTGVAFDKLRRDAAPELSHFRVSLRDVSRSGVAA